MLGLLRRRGLLGVCGEESVLKSSSWLTHQPPKLRASECRGAWAVLPRSQNTLDLTGKFTASTEATGRRSGTGCGIVLQQGKERATCLVLVTRQILHSDLLECANW